MFKVESHRKAAAATASGKFKAEIVPVTTKVKIITPCIIQSFH